jgi:hypothetical protein
MAMELKLHFDDIKLGNIHPRDAFGGEEPKRCDRLVLQYLTNLYPVFSAQFPVKDFHVLLKSIPFQALDNHACPLLVDPPQCNLKEEWKVSYYDGSDRLTVTVQHMHRAVIFFVFTLYKMIFLECSADILQVSSKQNVFAGYLRVSIMSKNELAFLH